ncbi:MAG: hypothetical protein ACO3JL_21710, partial [Myxococcota bacterium]
SLTSSDRAGATWERWSGAGRVYPLLGLAMVWLWSSLAGLPGTIGFASRVVTAQAAFGAGLDLLGIVVVVAPVLAAAPVLRLTIFLFAKTPDLELRASMSGWRTLVVVVAALVVFLLGIFPMPLLELGRHMGSLLPV